MIYIFTKVKYLFFFFSRIIDFVDENIICVVTYKKMMLKQDFGKQSKVTVFNFVEK